MIWYVRFIEAYATMGLAFALAFVTVGAGRIDPTARTGTWGFRVLIMPGAAALWPLLLARWCAAGATPNEQGEPR